MGSAPSSEGSGTLSKSPRALHKYGTQIYVQGKQSNTKKKLQYVNNLKDGLLYFQDADKISFLKEGERIKHSLQMSVNRWEVGCLGEEFRDISYHVFLIV